MMVRPPTDAKMPDRRRPATRHADHELWHKAVRDVRPLRAGPAPPATQTAVPSESTEKAKESRSRSGPRRGTAASAAETPAELRPITGPRAPGLDARSAEKLKRGRYPVEARLDLHGMTQDAAHSALTRFISAAAAQGLRCVLVITGKGWRRLAEAPEGGSSAEIGILRNAVPRWLNEQPTRAHILAFATAQQRDGGGGALYVLLRRQR
jgi:DNA-nicking Smr family endonuclease